MNGSFYSFSLQNGKSTTVRQTHPKEFHLNEGAKTPFLTVWGLLSFYVILALKFSTVSFLLATAANQQMNIYCLRPVFQAAGTLLLWWWSWWWRRWLLMFPFSKSPWAAKNGPQAPNCSDTQRSLHWLMPSGGQNTRLQYLSKSTNPPVQMLLQ